MEDELLIEMAYEKMKFKDPTKIIAAEVVARINDTTHLQLQVRKLWLAVFIQMVTQAILIYFINRP